MKISCCVHNQFINRTRTKSIPLLKYLLHQTYTSHHQIRIIDPFNTEATVGIFRVGKGSTRVKR